MNRVSTAGTYQSALLNLMTAQQREFEAGQRVSTEKVATNLMGFGRGAETLTALKSAQARVQGFIDTGKAVEARLASQALAFDQVAAGAAGARQAIADALASGSANGLMQVLDNHFQTAVSGLNASHQGRYLFAGAAVEQSPVTAKNLADLGALPASGDAFRNDNLMIKSRIDEGPELVTGFLADSIGGPLFEIFQALQQFHDDGSPGGRINGPIDDDLRTFLEGKMGELKTTHTGVIDAAARNGGLQNRVESVLDAHAEQELALITLVGKRTDADMAQAVTDLQLAQISLQASAQVISQLRASSLLELLRF